MHIVNRKVFHEYEILEKYTAGIMLAGPETKSAKLGRALLQGSFVVVRNGEAWIENLHISPYAPATREQKDYTPTRRRKLLLKKKEIHRLGTMLEQSGYSAVPLSLFDHHAWIKIEIALVRGKKKYDKRESIRKRETARTISRVQKLRRVR